MNENGKKCVGPLSDCDGAAGDCAEGAGTLPFGRGVGSGTFSAEVCASTSVAASMEPIVAARIAAAPRFAPRPAIMPLLLVRLYAVTRAADKPLPARYGEFAASRSPLNAQMSDSQ